MCALNTPPLAAQGSASAEQITGVFNVLPEGKVNIKNATLVCVFFFFFCPPCPKGVDIRQSMANRSGQKEGSGPMYQMALNRRYFQRINAYAQACYGANAAEALARAEAATKVGHSTTCRHHLRPPLATTTTCPYCLLPRPFVTTACYHDYLPPPLATTSCRHLPPPATTITYHRLLPLATTTATRRRSWTLTGTGSPTPSTT